MNYNKLKKYVWCLVAVLAVLVLVTGILVQFKPVANTQTVVQTEQTSLKIENDETVPNRKAPLFLRVFNRQNAVMQMTPRAVSDAKIGEIFEKNMPDRAGAVVVLNPNTGEILNAYSHTSGSRNIAFSGNYASGSTMKVLWAAVSVEEDRELKDFENPGVYAGIPNAGDVPNLVNLKDALKYSVNTYFACLADTKLTDALMHEYAKKFYMGKPLLVEGTDTIITSQFGGGRPALGIGQGALAISPLHMAMVCATIANDGVLMMPFMKSEGRLESPVQDFYRQKAVRVFSPETAERVTEGMIAVVNEEEGTGVKAKIDGVTVAGKTGTAQNETMGRSNLDHTWFISFAPAENPQIALAVLVEYSGMSGGDAAAPIAKDVIKYYLDLEDTQ